MIRKTCLQLYVLWPSLIPNTSALRDVFKQYDERAKDHVGSRTAPTQAHHACEHPSINPSDPRQFLSGERNTFFLEHSEKGGPFSERLMDTLLVPYLTILQY